jgi:putative ABC transport system substrate-binding protein
MSPELWEKRLEYLKVALPALHRIAVLYDKRYEFYLAQICASAETLGVTLLPIEFNDVPDFASAGGLLPYEPIQDDAVVRATGLIDRIVKGAKPGELPVEQPPRIVLVLNKRTANTLGIKLPPALLRQANRVVDY